MSNIPYILSSLNVTVYIDGEPNVVASGTPQYDLVIEGIRNRDLQAVKDAINIRQAIVSLSSGVIQLEGSTLLYDGRPLHGALVNRILTVVKNAGNAGPLLLLLENLMQNPSKRAVDELYGMLEACDLPITEDGHFLAYKRVNADYTSIHDGKTDNSIGAKPSMPRNAVDEDKDRTCSTGLHFCSKAYLPYFGAYGNGTRTVVVKINPRDVVSIPSDYNNAKGRACTYEIIGELTEDVTAGTYRELDSDYDVTFVRPLVDNDDPVDDDSDTYTAVSTPLNKGGLTVQQVRDIRNMLDDGWPLSAIAKAVGTSVRTVGRVRDGERYADVG